MSTQNIRPYNLKGGIGGRHQRNFAVLGVARGDEQFSDPLGDRNSFSAPGTSEMILPAHAGVKISIFEGVDESQPPKLTKVF